MMVCPVIKLPVGTPHSSLGSLIQVISAVPAEADSNDELQCKPHLTNSLHRPQTVCAGIHLAVKLF